MKHHFICFILSWFIIHAVAQTDKEWNDFKTKNKKNYPSGQEETKRKTIWEKNYKEVKQHNDNVDKGLATGKVALNFLADKTDEEYLAMLGKKPGSKASTIKPKTTTTPTTTTTTTTSTTTTPTTTTTTTTTPTTTTTGTTTTPTAKTEDTKKPKTKTTRTTTLPTTKITRTTTLPTTRSTTTRTKETTTRATTPATTKTTTTRSTVDTSTMTPGVLPTSVDYRNSTCTAPIKSQGQCGSCWAFSATYETEFFNCKKKGALTVLSEQNLVDCGTTTFGCNGGWYDNAWQYTIDALGQCSSSSYTYKAVQETCKRSSCTADGTLTGFVYVPNNVTAIMEVLANTGPVSASIYATPLTFKFYSSGVFEDPACSTKTNHAVNIVGYGTTDQGVPYWIIRNSWSTGWGMNGYGFVRRGTNTCGIEGEVAFPIA